MFDESVRRERKYEGIDLQTPINAPLSALYRRSFACYTIQQRLPTIITKIIDGVTRDKNELIELFGGDVAKSEVKEVIAQLSQLKYELQTNKEFKGFDGEEPDKLLWNNFLDAIGEKRTFCSAVFVYAECYLYRKVNSFFINTATLKEYDYFRKQKYSAFEASLSTIKSIVDSTAEFYRTQRQPTIEQLEQFFYKLLRVNLWGNRCDLSLTCGEDANPTNSPFDSTELLDELVIANDAFAIWNCVSGGQRERFDIILDNAGYELFTDLVMADFLLRYDFAGKVRFHCKAIPWFISDVMNRDFHWTIERLANSTVPNVSEFGKRLRGYCESQQFEVAPTEHFWTSPYEFDVMDKIIPDMYASLAQSHLLIFKGDLNYRKLLADVNWQTDMEFAEALQSFRPTNLCALRTVKCDLICGVGREKCEQLSEQNPKWMETGEYAVIQFAAKP